jgi:hypothetical protein
VAPPAPWTLRVSGVAWVHRAVTDADRAHQPGLRVRRSVPLTVAGLVAYAESPVGPYAEVWGAPTLVLRGWSPALAVPFMAVDSVASMEGGRANWALPKTLATFSGSSAAGEAWSLRARPASAGPRLPLLAAGRLVQVDEAGRELRARAVVHGVGRLARVDVETAGDVAVWLRGGRHPGVLLERGTLVVGAPIASKA